MNGKSFSLLFFGLNNSNYPYTRISHEILKECANKGGDVSAFFVKNNHFDSSFLDSRIKLNQCPNIFKSKALTYVSYSFFCFFYILKTFIKNKETCFIVPTTPPFILPFIVLLVKMLTFGKLKWIYHVQDIHPEISFVGQQKTYLYSFLNKMDTFFIRNSNRTITLSDEMKTSLIRRDHTLISKIDVVNNFVEKYVEPSKLIFDFVGNDKKNGKIIYIFSGNVGKFQKVAEIVEFFLELTKFDDVLYILGDGDELPRIEGILKDHQNKSRVRLLGRYPFDKANNIAAQCDYGIVSLHAEITKYAYPSKFATYLSMGLKVVAFVDDDSQIAQEIKTYELGFIVSTKNDLDSAILKSLALTPEERKLVQLASVEMFDKRLLVDRNYKILEAIYDN